MRSIHRVSLGSIRILFSMDRWGVPVLGLFVGTWHHIFVLAVVPRVQERIRRCRRRLLDAVRRAKLWAIYRFRLSPCTGADEDGVECGHWKPGEGKTFCPNCYRRMLLEFPQGWSYYPGDVCQHGKYVGGCGADLMCGRCESEGPNA